MKRGFTLIEVLIAMTIMAFIALAIYQNTSQSYVLRDKLQIDGDFYNSIRVALDMMGRDIVQIYTPQGAALPGTLGKAETPGADQGGNPGTGINYNFATGGNAQEFWAPPINSAGVRPSRFYGETRKISFISNSHLRVYKDSLESEFAKITYSIEEDKLSEKGSLALVKREDPEAFSDRDHSESEIRYTLLTNLKSLKFQFLDGEKDSWFSKWDTTNRETANVYPAIIEVELEIYSPGENTSQEKRTFKIKQRYRPELPI